MKTQMEFMYTKDNENEKFSITVDVDVRQGMVGEIDDSDAVVTETLTARRLLFDVRTPQIGFALQNRVMDFLFAADKQIKFTDDDGLEHAYNVALQNTSTLYSDRFGEYTLPLMTKDDVTFLRDSNGALLEDE